MNEIGYALARTNGFAKSIEDGFLVVSLRIGHLVYLLLDDAELLEVLGVLPVVRDEPRYVVMYFITFTDEVFVVRMLHVRQTGEVFEDYGSIIRYVVHAERILILQLQVLLASGPHGELLVLGLHSHLDEYLSLELVDVGLLGVDIVEDQGGVVSIDHGSEIPH